MTGLGRALEAALEQALGARVSRSSRLSGGDINDAFEIALCDGRRVFVKTNRQAPDGMFAAEARGLRWLASAGSLRVPRVLAVSSGGAEGGAEFLALELLDPAPRRACFDEELGRGLAALHASGAPSFGLDHDNFIGSLPQSNRSHATWPEFFRAERLEPQLRRAEREGRVGSSLLRAFDRLYGKLPELVGPPEAPARLHGDLWGGNLHVDEAGAPCLIDPAAYAGHREVDLAMMRLFGGFSERVFAAYAESHPLAPGHAERVPLYQSYPLLVHVNLFGGGYARSVEAVLARYV
ncbi:MAG TPA: fructosamine kinase family protein [Polyangiaceae bacterium]